uniref:Probable cytochrome P450 6a14 n=1 Tax=Culex pipiens TaxID=7175 RepID=A0A8D8HFP3_CULPI
MGLLSVVLLILAGAAAILFAFLKRQQHFWRSCGIPAARNPQLLTGNVAGMVSTEHMATTLQRLYREFKQRGLTFGGFNNFFAPTILLVEPELVKHVMVKDFGVFHDRGLYVDPEGDPLSGNLFNLEGHQWKVMRQKLSPTFTSGKMKLMFDTVASVAKELNQFVDENCHREDMELREVLQRFTVDVIGNVAFGIDCNTMKNPDSDFRKMGNKAFALTTTSVIKSFIGIQFKSLAKFMKMKITEDDVEQFFMELTRSTVQMREQNGSQRNDFMKLLLEIRDQGTISDAPNSAGEGLTMRELAAQCFVFFLAGFETSSSTMTFCLYELALNPDVQYRLREEIKEALNEGGGHLTYEALMKMDYLDRVVSETLRKHPPLDNTFRTNEVDYVIPGTNYTIPAGTFVQIPIYAIQRDPDNFPEPDKFDPDRFLPEAVKSRHPYAYIPFGEGPRICIGMRFGLMQAKLGLATLLANFQFSTSPRTSVPLVYDPPSITLGPKGGMYLRIERVE